MTRAKAGIAARTRRALLLLCLALSAHGFEPAEPEEDRPFMRLELREGYLSVEGVAASEVHGDAIRGAVMRRFPDADVAFSLETVAGLDADWQLMTLAAVDVVAEIAAGSVVIRPREARLRGLRKRDSLLDVRLDRLERVAPPGFAISKRLLSEADNGTAACDTMFTAIRGEPVRFRSGTTEFRPSSFALLDRYADYMTDCPATRLEIVGHTDASGDPELNLELSAARAAAVADYLVVAGVPAGQLSHRGVGSSEPIADNGDAWGRSKNRRIEIRRLR